MNSSGVRSCLICNSNCSKNNFPSRRSKNNWVSNSDRTCSPDKLLSPELEIYFTLRHVLDIPPELCEQFLILYGNPSQWGILTCKTCSVKYINQVRSIHIQIQELEAKLITIKQEVNGDVKKLWGPTEDFKNNEGQAQTEDCTWSPVHQKVHGWVKDNGIFRMTGPKTVSTNSDEDIEGIFRVQLQHYDDDEDIEAELLIKEEDVEEVYNSDGQLEDYFHNEGGVDFDYESVLPEEGFLQLDLKLEVPEPEADLEVKETLTDCINEKPVSKVKAKAIYKKYTGYGRKKRKKITPGSIKKLGPRRRRRGLRKRKPEKKNINEVDPNVSMKKENKRHSSSLDRQVKKKKSDVKMYSDDIDDHGEGQHTDPDYLLMSPSDDISLHADDCNSDCDDITNPETRTWSRNVKKFHCTLCRRRYVTFRDEIGLDAHRCKVHEGLENPFQCTLCKSYFKTRREMKIHTEKEHEGTNERGQLILYRCEICSKTFLSTESLKNHQTYKKHTCQKCEATMCSFKGLQLHIREAHPEDYLEMQALRSKFQCIMCEKNLLTAGGLKAHMESHKKLKKSFKCQVCGTVFTSKQNLNKHQHSKHTAELNLNPVKFNCQECGKTLASQETLRSHLIMFHTKEYKHLCSTCGKGYSTLQNFREHQKSHSDKRPEVCHICGKTFKTRLQLNYHRKLHTRERKFKCTMCEKAFKDSTKLKTHQQIHSGLLPFECKICQKKFAVKNYLYCHNRAYHQNPTTEDKKKKRATKTKNNTSSAAHAVESPVDFVVSEFPTI